MAWIKCSERMPDKEGEYTVMVDMSRAPAHIANSKYHKGKPPHEYKYRWSMKPWSPNPMVLRSLGVTPRSFPGGHWVGPSIEVPDIVTMWKEEAV